MTMTWLRTRLNARTRWLVGIGLALSLGLASAAPQQSPQRRATPPIPKAAPPLRIAPVPPRPNLQFQQAVQQQQLRKELQQSQVQGQLQQSVSNVARQPYANNPAVGQQFDQADRARQDLDRARQQSLIDRYWGMPLPPPRPGKPAPARSGK